MPGTEQHFQDRGKSLWRGTYRFYWCRRSWGLRRIHQNSRCKTRLHRPTFDSKCVTDLLKRRPGLEAKGFLSGSANRLLKNAPLYRKFYKFQDELAFEVIKVKGHSPSSSRDTIERIFSFVDKETRKELRLWMEELKKPGRFGHYNHHV